MDRTHDLHGATIRGLLGLLLLAGPVAGPAAGQQPGEDLFRSHCAACHSTGPERRLGPGLEGVLERRDRGWLRSIIVEPDRLLRAGDPIALALLEEYGIPMPNLGLTHAQAESILDYLAGARPGAAAAAAVPRAPATPGQIALGGRLFDGTTRLQNRGASCNACHDAAGAGVFGGGSLARDLASTYARVGEAGLRPILERPPFPVMQRAYQGRPLTPAEVDALVAFLQHAAGETADERPSRALMALLGSGATGSLALLLLYSALWPDRRRGSLHQSLFDRQVRSR
jgi:mono/diheme cytochrome c family protein